MNKFKTDFPQKHYEAYEKEISPRPFLFSESCVSYEIKLHCLVHWIATGSMVITYASPVYYLYVAAGIYLRGYTKVIEIVEQDVLKKRDAKMFDYFSGIAKCYRKTAADPYWNGKKRDEKYFKSSWKNRIIPYEVSK